MHYITKISYDPSEPLVIHAFLVDDKKNKVALDRIKASLTDGGLNGRVLATLDMRDDGSQGDKKDDLIYTAAFTLRT